ncbi:MAG: tryptophan 7-halogenase [Magnetococcales bacterium]|nr:tryptophan 7-halogenase [Magnetococcales bacterium]
MSIPTQCDVVIIGSGPAGSSAATLLSQKGYEVVVLDKTSHPRRVVGESLLPHVWKFTDILGVTKQIEQANFIEKAGGIVQWQGAIKRLQFKDFGHKRPALHVEREIFDKILCDHAKKSGGLFFERVIVRNVDFSDQKQGSVVHYQRLGEKQQAQIRCRYVIDASGPDSFLSRRLKTRQPDPDFGFTSIWGYFKGDRYLASDGIAYPYAEIREKTPVTFVNSLGQWAWSWFIPLREQVSVGMLLPPQQLQAFNGSAEDFFLDICQNQWGLRELLKPEQYIAGSFRQKNKYTFLADSVVGPRYYLVGDASGFVDPIYANGVVSAMYTAYLAAWSIHQSLKNPENAFAWSQVYSSQIQGHQQILHAVALPLDVPKSNPDTVKKGLWFQSREEKSLMFAVAAVSGRLENVHRLYPNDPDALSFMEKLKTFDTLQL